MGKSRWGVYAVDGRVWRRVLGEGLSVLSHVGGYGQRGCSMSAADVSTRLDG